MVWIDWSLIIVSVVVIHEMLHYIPILFSGYGFECFILSYSSVGFLIDNDFLRDDLRLHLYLLFPFTASAVFFYNPGRTVFLVFSIVNLLWSTLDIALLAKFMDMHPEERVRWADRKDEKARSKALLTVEL